MEDISQHCWRIWGHRSCKSPFLQAPVRRVLSGKRPVCCAFPSLMCLLCSSVPRRHCCRTRYLPTSLTDPSPGSPGTIRETLCGLEQIEIPPALPVPFWCLRARCSHLQWNLANSWPESLCQGALVTGKGQRGGQQGWQQKP